jgi:multidrug resistance efflux pump
MMSQPANAPTAPTAPGLTSPSAETTGVPLPNGSSHPGHVRVPKATPRRRTRVLLLIAGGVVLTAAVLITVGVARGFRTSRVDLVTHTVRKERLELTVVERGALESADNHDILCRVKSGAKNSTVASTIKTLVDDGSTVKKDQLLIELDDSGLIEQLKTQKIDLDKAESDKIKAEEDYKIQVSQNESDIKSAETVLQLAEIDLQKYIEGDFPQALKDVEGRTKVAESDLEQQRDRAAWAQRMVKKGYQTVSQAQAEQSKQESLEIALNKVNEEKRVLVDPVFGTKKRTETDLGNKVAEAKRALERVQLQAKAKEVQARTLRDTNRSLYQQQLTKYHEIEDEIKKCRISAPEDGMVVYYVPEQARGGGGAQQSIIAQGEPVREGQKLMQIPDLKHMLVATKVHEALVSKVKRGQRATVRIDAYPDRKFAAHIASVATISAQQDFFAADVKVYVTKVAIDEEVENLKPGMSAEVTITVGDALEHVLTVPVQAIVGSVEMGGRRRCYVLKPDGGTEERTIVVGMSNDRMAEIREGLEEGDEVILNPKAVAGDSIKTAKPGAAQTKDAPAKDEPGRVGPSGPGKESPGKEKSPGRKSEGKSEGGPGGPGGSASPEDRQKQQQAMTERFKNAPPQERKQMLEQVPEQFRDKVKANLKAQGIDIPD